MATLPAPTRLALDKLLQLLASCSDRCGPGGGCTACREALCALFGAHSAAGTPEGAATLADPQRIEQLAAAPEGLLMMRSNRRIMMPTGSITAYHHDQLRSSCLRVLQRVAAVAASEYRLVPWVNLLAHQLLQLLQALPAKDEEEQQQNRQWQQLQQPQAASHNVAVPGRLLPAALQDWSSDEDESEQPPVTTAAAAAVDPAAAAASAALTAAGHPAADESSAGGDGSLTLADSKEEELVLELLPAGGAVDEPQAHAVAEIVQLLECLVSVATCRKGLLALAPHVQLLQEASAALQQVVTCSRSRALRQHAMKQWAAHTAAAALAALRNAQQEHTLACNHLRCEINSTASAYSAAAASSRMKLQQGQQQQQHQGDQQQQVDLVEASDGLAAASSWVEGREQLLQLAAVPTASMQN